MSTATDKSVANTDVLIIGAGIVGAATAMYLARTGTEVTLLDRGSANGEASGGNAGSLHLQLLPLDFSEAESSAQSPAVRTLPLQKLGIETWLELEADLQADFQLAITGGLMLADSDTGLQLLRKKAALERQCGIEVEILSASETRQLLPAVSEHIVGAAYCRGEGKVNPLGAITPLIAEACDQGAQLFEDTEVQHIERVRRAYRVSTDRGVVDCKRIVNASGAWSANIAAMLGVRLPVRCAPQQMLITQVAKAGIPFLLALAGRRLTMKQTASGNVLIGGGWPADIDPQSGRSVVLRESIEGNLWAAMRVMPLLGGLDIIRSWAARGVMIDGAPIIGALPGHPDFYTAVGANGYTMGPIFGRILAELMTGGQAPVDLVPFSPERFN